MYFQCKTLPICIYLTGAFPEFFVLLPSHPYYTPPSSPSPPSPFSPTLFDLASSPIPLALSTMSSPSPPPPYSLQPPPYTRRRRKRTREPSPPRPPRVSSREM